MKLDKYYPALAEHLDTNLIAQVLDKLDLLATQAANLQIQIQQARTQEMVQATPYWREQKYLYLIHPKHDGQRRREYIGKDEQKQKTALQNLENWKTYQKLDQQYKRIIGNLEYWTTELDRVLHRIIC